MNKLATHLHFFSRILCPAVISLLIASGSSTAIAASNLDSCALLKPADLATLLGGKVVAKKPGGGGCSWTASGSKRRLVAAPLVESFEGVTVDKFFISARQEAAKDKDTKFADEAGLGDKAFSMIAGGVVSLHMLKNGRMLQLLYMDMSGATASAKEMSELRSVAKKAIAAF